MEYKLKFSEGSEDTLSSRLEMKESMAKKIMSLLSSQTVPKYKSCTVYTMTELYYKKPKGLYKPLTTMHVAVFQKR